MMLPRIDYVRRDHPLGAWWVRVGGWEYLIGGCPIGGVARGCLACGNVR